MKFKKESPLKKRKYIFGTYALRKWNKENNQIKSKLLGVLGGLFIAFFIISMIGGLLLFGSMAYYRISSYVEKEETVFDYVSGVSLVVPSLEKDSIKELNENIEDVSSGEKEMEDIKKSYLVFLPFYLFIPIIFIVTSIHEFGHYIMCRKFGVRVKEYGVGCPYLFYVPIPLFFAYVLPTEKDFKKTSKFNYLSIISGGCGMNFLLTILLFFFMFLWFNDFFFYLFQINLGIMLFNSLPMLFFDGGLFVKRFSKKLNYLGSFFVLACLVMLI